MPLKFGGEKEFKDWKKRLDRIQAKDRAKKQIEPTETGRRSTDKQPRKKSQGKRR